MIDIVYNFGVKNLNSTLHASLHFQLQDRGGEIADLNRDLEQKLQHKQELNEKVGTILYTVIKSSPTPTIKTPSFLLGALPPL